MAREEFSVLCETLSATLRDHVPALVDGRKGAFSEQVASLGLGGQRFTADIAGFAAAGDTGTVATVIVTLRPEPAHPDEAVPRRRRKILTEMDSRILEGVAAGVPTNKLATMVDLSRGGVEYHVTNLLRKLKAPNRTSLVAKAYAHGILAPGMWPPKVVPDWIM